LVELYRLSETLGGPRILMKRDDQTGLALGGNKTRKLEFLVGEAVEQGCDALITGGAAQSNHCRQTAAAAAASGLLCHLVLGGTPPEIVDGNLLLDYLLGANIHWSGEFRKGETIPEVAEQLEQDGFKPYVIPYGGSNATGAAAFVYAVAELQAQLNEMSVEVSHVLFASSSGGTQAGLVLGAYMFNQPSQLIGIGIEKGETGEDSLETQIINIANSTAKRLKVDTQFSLEDITVRNDYIGKGYGIVGELERQAIRLTAKTEGILLDPVYTGRAMGGLIDMIKRSEISSNDTVLFWHTGGVPALFPYSAELI
jgi:D-cysteine desulfhydrase